MVMDISRALTYGKKLLKDAGADSPLDARVLLCHVLKKDELWLVVHGNEFLTESEQNLYCELLARRLKKEPVSYITGHKEFMGLDFDIEPGVLVPRPETEHIVEYITQNFKSKHIDVLDICSGSGCIGVSVAYYLENAFVTAVDISPVAIEVSAKNAEKLGVKDRFDIEKKDALKHMEFEKKFDIVISNPPYIPNQVVKSLDADVKDFEPHLALCGGEDGYDFYKAITMDAPSLLKKNGLLIYEVGHDMADGVKKIMSKDFENIEYIKDLAGFSRVVYGTLK